MTDNRVDIEDFHWLIDTLQNIDVGLVVLNQDYTVALWNTFMENHSGIIAEKVKGFRLFDLFEDIPEQWFRRKAESVFMLKSRAFTTWEQRPYLFKFKNYRPITGTAEFMYQDISLIPLQAVDGSVKQIGVIIYDVTDIAVNKIKLEAANDQLEMLSRTDHLTQLNNRGCWEENLAKEFKRFKRSKNPCSVVMFDIDHFKKVNDTYGHQAGDEVIRQTAQALRETMRTTDIAGRYGGEEFGVILLDAPADQALIFTERLRQRIEASTVLYEDTAIKYTISLGICELTDSTNEYKEWLEGADQALYQSKEAGRNQSTVCK